MSDPAENATLPEMPREPKQENLENQPDASAFELTVLTLAVAAAIFATLGAIVTRIF